MTTPPPYHLEEKTIIIKPYFKSNKEYPQRAKGISFFVLVFSIFIYFSIFYIFNLSPSLNSKFWFFISNTLILIIAADYGVFSSSGRGKHDFYEEYVMHRQARSVSSFVSQYPETAKTSNNPKEEFEIDLPSEKKMETDQPERNPKVPEKRSMKGDNEAGSNDEKKLTVTEETKKTYQRSQSDKAKRDVIEENKSSLRSSRSKSERKEEPPTVDKENEFSNMSDEELNRRVEEFIQKFNRQIRLQKAGNFK